jgi:hypothetical protein
VNQFGIIRFYLLHRVRAALGPTLPTDKLELGFFSKGKAEGWGGSEVKYSSPSSSEVKNVWIYISIRPTCLHGVDKETFTAIFNTMFLYFSYNNLILFSAFCSQFP